ncbi:hypothetical protein, partial [Arcticibacter svalbardensis]|uniref:hypothetical protein n=1 Tax=Arcticibacter svalbardensis TaxID=1288027 RepID=UPI00058E9276
MSRRVIDTILNNLYGIGEQGLALCGMDDAGEMSALFDEVKWKTSSGKVLTITKRGKGRVLISIKVNG